MILYFPAIQKRTLSLVMGSYLNYQANITLACRGRGPPPRLIMDEVVLAAVGNAAIAVRLIHAGGELRIPVSPAGGCVTTAGKSLKPQRLCSDAVENKLRDMRPKQRRLLANRRVSDVVVVFEL
jgi:hypothetical protein